MNVRLSKTAVPAAAALVVFALVAGACGSDEQAADGRHGVFEDTEAEFVRCMSTEEVNKTVTVCPDGSQRVVYESGGGYTLTALDENECQTKYWDDDHYSVSREGCGDGSYEEEYRDGRIFGRTATDAQGCRGYYGNDNYESFDCEDGSGWGKDDQDGAWTRTPTDAEGCTYLVSQIHSETDCDDGSGSGVDRSGFTWSRDVYDADNCRTTLYGGGSLVSSRNCPGGAEDSVFRGGWELSADAYPWHSGLDCRTTTWSSGGVVAATDQYCGALASESDWFDGLSWVKAAQEETTDAEGVREWCTTTSFNNGIDERSCYFTEGVMHLGQVTELVNREDASLILRVEDRNEEEGRMWCTTFNVSGIISGNARSCYDRNFDETATITLGDLTYSTQPGDSDDCTVYSSNFDGDVQVCFDAETWTQSGVLADGTSWTAEFDGRCQQFTTDEVWSDSVCWTDRGGRNSSGAMRDGTTYESVELIGERTGWVVNDEIVQVDDWNIRSPESALMRFGVAGPGGFDMAVPSELHCSRLSQVVSPRISLLCAALGIEPMFTTEFVPPPIDQAAIDQAAALQAAVDVAKAAEAAAAAAEDAAAQAAAAQALAVAEAEQALAQAAADQDAAAQAAAAQALAQAAAEQAAAETAAAAAQAAAAQAAAAQAAVDQAAAEAAAAQAAAAQAAAEQALADAAAQAILDAGLVSTGYTAEEFASISAAAESLGISLSEFQATGVHIIDFLTQLAGGYEIVVPLTDPPDANGPESVTSTWDEQARDVIGRVSTGYGATEAEAQKFGAFLLTFFVALSGG